MKIKKKCNAKGRLHRKYSHRKVKSKILAQKLLYKAKCKYLQDVVRKQSEIIEELLKK